MQTHVYRRWNAWQIAAILLAFALLSANIYRSVTQSFTIDEAFSYNRFIKPTMAQAWFRYDANHHVLLALLARASAQLLGPSEFSLRLPVLAGGAIYLFAAIPLLRRFLPQGPLFLLTYCALTLNPFLLDFLSAARGYGLALGLFVAGLLCATWEGWHRTWLLLCAGICFGLAISANLVFAIPVAAAIAAYGISQLMARKPVVLPLAELSVPTIATAAAILTVPMHAFQSKMLNYGSDTLREMIASLLRFSFRHHDWFGESAFEQSEPALVMVIAILSLVLAVAAFTNRPLLPASRMLMLTFSCTVLVIALFHFATGLKYPYGRTGIYLPPLLVLALAAFAHAVPSRSIRVMTVALFAFSTAAFLCQWNTRVYSEWAFDSGTRRNLEFIAQRPNSGPVRLGATWLLAETINFYRDAYRMTWLPPVSRNKISQDSTYYILLPEDAYLIAERHLRILREDPGSGQIVAEPVMTVNP